MQMMLKCADIGHLAADSKTHKRWAYQLEEEFFQQVRCLTKLANFCFLRCSCASFGPDESCMMDHVQRGALWVMCQPKVFTLSHLAQASAVMFESCASLSLWMETAICGGCEQLAYHH